MAMDILKKSLENSNASVVDMVEGFNSQGMEVISDEELDEELVDGTKNTSIDKELAEELDEELAEELDEELEGKLNSELDNTEEKEETEEVEDLEEKEEVEDLEEKEEVEEVEDLEEKEEEVLQSYNTQLQEDKEEEEIVEEEKTVPETSSEDLQEQTFDILEELSIDTQLVSNNHSIQVATFNPPESLERVTGVCNFNPTEFRSLDIMKTDLNYNILRVENCDVIDLKGNKILLSKSYYDNKVVNDFYSEIAETLKLGRNYKCNLIDLDDDGFVHSKLSALELASLSKSFEKVIFKVFVINTEEQEQCNLCLCVKLA